VNSAVGAGGARDTTTGRIGAGRAGDTKEETILWAKLAKFGQI